MSDRPEAWAARRRAWRVERLRPSLERLPERRERFVTLGDLPVEGLYGPWDLRSDPEPGPGDPASGAPRAALDQLDHPGPGGPTAVDHRGDPLRLGAGRYADADLVRDLGLPGEPPFTRGIHPTGYRSRPWTMRMFAGFGSAEDTNGRFRQLLAAGQTGLSVAYDMPTLYGYDTDDPEAEGEFGTCGVAVSSLADMEVLLDGLPLDRVSTSMTINSPAAPIWAMYIAAAEKSGVPRDRLEGTIQNDILKEYVAQKEFLFPPEPSMRLVVDTIEFGTRELPRWNTVSISGYHIREAGATAVQELAFTIADGMAYVEAAIERGLRVDDFAPRLSFFFNSHSDFFEEIAKFRASRRIWWKLMSERYRAENERSTWMRFHTQTAGVSLTPQQPLNNLTRVATQALAAILGGTQSLHTDAYDEALAVPTAEAALLALRQQQVLLEETGVASTIDPLGGSWFVEALTNRVEREVWRYLDEIDRRGGMVAAIGEGYPQREIADSAYRFQREFDAGERIIVGVNGYADDESVTVPVLAVPPGSLERHLARLERTRAERDNEAVGAALAGLREAASRPGTSETNLMPHFLRCAAAYATLGEQCRVLREVFGEYREPVAV
jgi:methylmalonyl-CoA mutase N-terminal domain/subunit